MVAAVTLVALIYAAYSDLARRIIPNWLTLAVLLVGLLYHLLKGSIIYAAVGFILTVILLIFLSLFMSLGAGDIKFFLALGVLLGPAAVLIILGSLTGAVIVGLCRRQKKILVPLAPYMLASYLFIGGVFYCI